MVGHRGLEPEASSVPDVHRVEMVVRPSSPVRSNTGDSRAAGAGLVPGLEVKGDVVMCLRLDIRPPLNSNAGET